MVWSMGTCTSLLRPRAKMCMPFSFPKGTQVLIVPCRYFSYFTHLSYIGLIAYQFAAGVQTLCYASSGRSSYPLQRWPRFLQFLHRLLYATVTTYRKCFCSHQSYLPLTILLA